MDHGFTKFMKELDRFYTMLQELHSVIIGGALIHKNHEGSKHEGQRIHLTIGHFGGTCVSNQSSFNNGRIKEWGEEKKEVRVPTTRIFRSKILINNSICSLIIDCCSMNNLVSRKLIDFLKLPMEICPIKGYQVFKVPVTIIKFDKVEVLCIVEILMTFIYYWEDLGNVRSWIDRWEYGIRGKKYEGFRVDMKRKSIVDKVNAVRYWSSPKTLLKVRNNNVADAFQEEDKLEYVEPLDGEAEQVTRVVQRTLCLPKALVKAFKLPIKLHPSLYEIGWIKKGPKLKVTEICKVPIAIGKHYNELVNCDVVDIKACHIMPTTMMTRSAGWPAATSRGRGTCGRADRGVGRIKVNGGVDGVPDFSTIIAQQLQNLLLTIVAQVGDQCRGQGAGRNQNGNAVNDHIRGDVGSTTKEYSVPAVSSSLLLLASITAVKQIVINHAMVEDGHAAYTNRFHELARLVSHLVTMKGTLTDEALRNGSIKKHSKKRGNKGEPSKDRNVRDDNKRTRTGNAFATTANPVRGGYTSTAPKCTTCRYHHSPETACHSCFNCNRLGHFAKDCRVAPMNVNPINARNPLVRTYYECVRIPLLDGKVLRVLGEIPKEKMRQLMSAKANENKQKEIVVVKDFPEDNLRKSKTKVSFDQAHRLGEHRFIEDFSKIVKLLTVLTQKSKTFDWDEKQNNAFQTLKDKLCNAHVLDLSNGPEDFVVYYDASGLGLGCVLMQRDKVIAYASSQKELNMRQRRWIELFSDYDCEIRYHPGMANVVADALSRKERVKPKRVRAMNMTIQSSIKDKILAAQKEASDESARLQKGLDEMIELRNDGALYYLDRIWIPLEGDVRTLLMDEAHKLKYSIHPGVDKMYYDLRDRYWWLGMKKDITVYVSKCLTCLKVNAEHQRPSGLLQQPDIPERKWKGIAIDFVTKFPRTSRTRLDMSMADHHQTDSQSESTIQTLEDMLRACVLDFGGSWDVHLLLVEFSYNSSYHSSMRCAPFEALHGRNCCSPIMWVEIKDRLKTACDHQKSYANKRRKPLEFSVGDYVLLKVSPWKGVVRFGKKGKVAPRFVGPFETIEKVGPVAYGLDLPEKLDGVHDTFHVSNLKKCLADPTLQVPLDEIQVDARLNFVEEPMEILEREFKKLKRSRIAIVKVRWNSKRGPKFTWEREDQMKLNVDGGDLMRIEEFDGLWCIVWYVIEVATLRALVCAGDQISGDASFLYFVSCVVIDHNVTFPCFRCRRGVTTLVTLVASPKEFQAERKETGVSYALVVKGVEDVMENAISMVIKPLLAEFCKIVTDDTLDALPPLRNIQHQIDLVERPLYWCALVMRFWVSIQLRSCTQMMKILVTFGWGSKPSNIGMSLFYLTVIYLK
nr:retrotransposon protein, putative, Ty3-gypsy subclass [Tanacetum cinerariifolium]